VTLLRLPAFRRFVRGALCGLGLTGHLPGQDVRPSMLLLDGAVLGSSVVAVGERGTVLVSMDRGASWRRSSTPTRATLTGVSFPAVGLPRRGWAVGHEAEILVSVDRGLTWARQYQGTNRTDSFLDVIALDERRAIAVGAYGLFVSTDDGGATWSPRKIRAEDSHLNRISAGPTGKLYLAGESGTLLRSSDKGATWSEIRSGYQGSFYGILPLGEAALLAHGLRGHVLRSDDDGASWKELPGAAPVLLACAVPVAGKGILLAGQARNLYLSADRGLTLTAAAGAPATGVAEVVDLGNGRVLALGEAGATLLQLP
jgi:photosystem II stability/assembly factor-like uncharacterized protein